MTCQMSHGQSQASRDEPNGLAPDPGCHAATPAPPFVTARCFLVRQECGPPSVSPSWARHMSAAVSDEFSGPCPGRARTRSLKLLIFKGCGQTS